jgi:hypothetical protein
MRKLEMLYRDDGLSGFAYSDRAFAQINVRMEEKIDGSDYKVLSNFVSFEYNSIPPPDCYPPGGA